MTGEDLTTSPDDWGIIGHRRVVDLLRQVVATNHLSHAYLFTGPYQVGKFTMAKKFASALNCEQSSPPCGTCRTCRRIDKGVHPDVQVISLAQESRDNNADEGGSRGRRPRVKNVNIDRVRAMLHDVALAPYEARWKCYIIRYAEDLSLDAIQMLLKTLEEPPAHVVLTLTTVDAKILPLTVVSRCQQISLGPVPPQEIERAFKTGYDVPPERASLLAHLSEGRPGWAIGVLNNPARLAARERTLGELLSAQSAGVMERLALAEELASQFGRDPEAVQERLGLWLTWWRDVLLAKHGDRSQVVNQNRMEQLAACAEHCPCGELLATVQSIRTTRQLLQQNVNPRLALEVMMLGAPRG